MKKDSLHFLSAEAKESFIKFSGVKNPKLKDLRKYSDEALLCLTGFDVNAVNKISTYRNKKI